MDANRVSSTYPVIAIDDNQVNRADPVKVIDANRVSSSYPVFALDDNQVNNADAVLFIDELKTR